jgi:HPt (histidine-containing phosphotransfer) domain-containing protein
VPHVSSRGSASVEVVKRLLQAALLLAVIAAVCVTGTVAQKASGGNTGPKPSFWQMVRVIQIIGQFAGLDVLARENPSVKKEKSMSVDREELLNRVEHDEELARELLGIFQTEALANRDSLRSAVESRNADAVRNAAHAFKGMLANLAANPASAAAAQLEALAKENKTGELAPAWQAFDKELGSVMLEVEHLLAGALQ